MYNQSDIDRLVAAAAEAMSHGQGTDELGCALEPFRPKKPRVGLLAYDKAEYINVLETLAIELTDEVKLRLSDTAGVDRNKIWNIVKHGIPSGMASQDTDAIMALIAKGKVDYE